MADIREFSQELVALTGEEVKRMNETIHSWEYLDLQFSTASNPFARVGVHKCRAKSDEQRKKQIAKRRKKNKQKRH